MVSHTFKGLENDLTYYARIFPVNPDGAAQSELDGQVASAETSSFPSEPTEYILTDTITASQTWTAPADGYYQVEVFGASGSGGVGDSESASTDDGWSALAIAPGGGGGSGGYSQSIFKLKAGDTLIITIGAVGATTSVEPNNTTNEDYDTITITSGANGGNGNAAMTSDDSKNLAGAGGAGGTASGGNVDNINGNAGTKGTSDYDTGYPADPQYYRAGTGGAAVGDGANAGGNGGAPGSGKAGKAGYIKILTGVVEEEDAGVPLTEFEEGTVVMINENGTYNAYYLAKHDYESGLNGAGRTLLVRKDSYGKYAYNASAYTPEYTTSNVDTVLNGNFKGLLPQAVQDAIDTTTFYYTPHSTGSVTTLARSVFLLSATELGGVDTSSSNMYTFNTEGTELPIADSLRPTSQWTRSPRTGATQPIYVTAAGKVGSNGPSASLDIYPAFTIPSTMTLRTAANADGSYDLNV